MHGKFVASRSHLDPSEFDTDGGRSCYNLWQRREWPYRELQVGDTIYWYATDEKAIVCETIVLTVDHLEFQEKQEAVRWLRANNFDSSPESNPYFKKKAKDRGYCLAFKVRRISSLNAVKSAGYKFPQLGWLRCDDPIAIEWLAQLPRSTEGTEGGLLPNDSQWSQVEDINEVANDPDIKLTVKKALIDARLGQGKFRKAVLLQWGQRCAITSAVTEKAIRASHIKPWRESNNDERLDPNNGLPLIASLDALFDAGLISFEESGKMIVSSELSITERSIFGVVKSSLTKPPTPKMAAYLAYHRKKHGFKR